MPSELKRQNHDLWEIVEESGDIEPWENPRGMKTFQIFEELACVGRIRYTLVWPKRIELEPFVGGN